MEFQIHCPYHLKPETLELPESYKDFEGEVKCAPPPGESAETLKVRLAHGFLVDAYQI